MSKTNNPSSLRQQLETTLDFISRAALGHDIGHCVHFANKAEAELRCAIDALAAVKKQERDDLIAVFNQHIETSGLDDDCLVTVLECREALKHAAELREAK
ncbi:hypothetical protein FOT62_23485 [Serratia marcescens]|uniref:Uncharacterized protein n=1 Tax=Serratia marcescens TaxID=615 RepID=A0A5C7BPW3_SERMA|nr:hypothetical protein [Serratia marcescens]TXE26193.1 hypothetical protein FOT62_23485 [Serratia marcescens]TXE54392.1 hypothetical protein FOT56_26125 [Serratia marcescens]